ncbi:MAG TPA: type I DNA topoisomerase [Chloroflexota bacterium]|nr:type I DNA topoisomerase [Chloroflexota bacterium]
MSNKLVIVESPTKAKTIGKYLGRDYHVLASLGHVRDLPKSKLGVDLDRDFQPQYLIPREKSKTVKELRSEAQRADEIFVATDPDREGEAIAWHLVETIDPGDRPVRRVEFHEITKNAVLAAMANPRAIDAKRVDAQQARRILDRLVGYQISPLLWKKVRRGLSAGRVQSAALRMTVEREREIAAFEPVEYWSIDAELAKRAATRRGQPRSFVAGLIEVNGQKAEMPDEQSASAIVRDLEGAGYVVDAIRRREQQRNPPAPFTTSTLQQEASRKLGFTAKRTMMVAQQLYEGIDLADGEGVGLITYMRTDSTNVAQSAIVEARQYIEERHGREMVSETPRTYQTRSRLAQEAHEAIRPTSAYRTPDDVRQFLSRDQARLYELIWKRFIATQMASARIEITTVEVLASREGSSNRYRFRASGSVVLFAGFLSLYTETRDEDAVALDEDRKPLPPLDQGEALDLVDLKPEQHFTQPPPRYTEASLVKALEERGIGRPSTYAPILSTLQDRGYVMRVDRRLEPTELGMLVNDLLVEHFPEVVDVDFTANMEERLDDIAQGRRNRVPVLREFYGPFSATLAAAEQEMERVTPPVELADEVCEKCGRQMVVKLGRFGKFIACPGFPACRNAKPFLVKIGVPCPECESEIVERRTRKRRVFYGCSRYPECEWTSWSRPLRAPCPTCGGLLVEAGRNRAKCTVCGTVMPSPEAGRDGDESGLTAAVGQ